MNDRYSWETDKKWQVDLFVTGVWALILLSLTAFWGGFFVLVWKIADRIL